MIFDFSSSITKKATAIFWLFVIALSLIFTYTAFQQLISGNKKDKVLGQQEVVIDTLSGSNASLLKSISDRTRIEEKAKVTIQDVIDRQQINKDTKAAEHREVEKKVVEIKKDYNTKISESVDVQKSVQLIKEKEAAVSRVRITSLWSNYCKSEPVDQICKENKI